MFKRISIYSTHLCREYASGAVETVCCAQIVCSTCAEVSAMICPKCGTAGVKYRENAVARKVIAELEEPCVNGCGELVTRTNAKGHSEICSLRVYHCPQSGCCFSGFENKFVTHMNESHRRLVLSRLTQLPVPPPAEEVNQPGQYKNRNGYLATMGMNGKFYCGKGEVLKRKRTTDMSTNMEKGRCGPATTRGSNCNACMALDIQFRGLLPGHLVNADGVIANALPCIHGKKPNERRRGSILDTITACGVETCGAMPLYTCDKPFMSHRNETKKLEAKCEAMTRCSSCEILRLQLENGAYADVWVEARDTAD